MFPFIRGSFCNPYFVFKTRFFCLFYLFTFCYCVFANCEDKSMAKRKLVSSSLHTLVGALLKCSTQSRKMFHHSLSKGVFSFLYSYQYIKFHLFWKHHNLPELNKITVFSASCKIHWHRPVPSLHFSLNIFGQANLCKRSAINLPYWTAFFRTLGRFTRTFGFFLNKFSSEADAR